MRRDFAGDHGDRRQQLVFIGLGLERGECAARVAAALDSCLLTDGEMAVYARRAPTSRLPSAQKAMSFRDASLFWNFCETSRAQRGRPQGRARLQGRGKYTFGAL